MFPQGSGVPNHATGSRQSAAPGKTHTDKYHASAPASLDGNCEMTMNRSGLSGFGWPLGVLVMVIGACVCCEEPCRGAGPVWPSRPTYALVDAPQVNWPAAWDAFEQDAWAKAPRRFPGAERHAGQAPPPNNTLQCRSSIRRTMRNPPVPNPQSAVRNPQLGCGHRPRCG